MKEQEAIELLGKAVPVCPMSQAKYNQFIDAVNMGIDALENQIKLKTWIENYKKKDELLFDKSNVISLLEEFRLE